MTTENDGGAGGEAVALAEELAVEAVETAAEIMRKPQRGAGSQLAACRLILDVAGVGATAADQRHTELLGALKGKLSDAAHEEVIRALAELTGQRSGGEPDPGDNEPSLQ
jgi:hypothetical protein